MPAIQPGIATGLTFPQSASEKAIKKHKRLSSLKYHPDKVRPDESKNETMEMLNDRWVDMSKAYSALLDEEVRNNWMQYGHPDGKQSFSIGIALPKLMVTEGNGKYVLLFYALILGVALPYVVGKWWYGTQALTKDGVVIASAGKMFKEYKEEIDVGGVAAATSTGEEFQQLLKGSKADAGLSRIEKSIVAADARPSDRDRVQLKEIDDPFRRKVLALLWAYLARVELGDSTLESEKYAVAPIAFLLNDSFTSIALAFGVVAPLLASYHASQHIIQALLPDSSPLLQLPYFTPKLVKAIEGADVKTHMSVQKYMSLPHSTRRRLAADLSNSQYATAMQVAQQMPNFVVAKAFFKVIGDKVITPSALVQLVVKGRIIPPGTRNIPEVKETDLEDIDPDEGDLDALLGRRPAKSRRKKPISDEPPNDFNKENTIQPPLAHAPYFARDHSPRWRVFLTDARAGRIGVPPFTFTEFENPIFDADNKPTFNMQTFKCQFQAPPQVGQFAFKMHLICDSYVGLDSTVDVILDVQDMSKAAVVESEEEISEPEEDTLAGQVQAMKGGAAGKPKRKKVEDSDEEDEDESDTDGDVEDTSDTDTETDEE
jgi:translocation protein SEC63